MSRGSGKGGGGDSFSIPPIELAGESGELTNQGRAKIRKKILIEREQDLGKVPQLTGYRAVQCTYTKVPGGFFEQTTDYVAKVKPLEGLVEKLQGVEGTFEMSTSYESHPIELHPKIDKLVLDYGGYYTPDGFAKWPPFYAPVGGSGLSGGEQTRNPMFGVTRYKAVSMIFRHTFYEDKVTDKVYEKAGMIVEKLPAGFPIPKGDKLSNGSEIKRRWLMQMPAVSREGGTYRIVQDYVLLDNSGVAEGLYETTQPPGQTS